jgi:hypothetical protein
MADGTIQGSESLAVTMTLSIGALKLEQSFDGKIPLQ